MLFLDSVFLQEHLDHIFDSGSAYVSVRMILELRTDRICVNVYLVVVIYQYTEPYHIYFLLFQNDRFVLVNV